MLERQGLAPCLWSINASKGGCALGCLAVEILRFAQDDNCRTSGNPCLPPKAAEILRFAQDDRGAQDDNWGERGDDIRELGHLRQG